MSLSFSWKWPGSHSASSPRMRGIRNHWTISVIENPTCALSSHEPSPVVHLSPRALIANSKPKHKLTARFFVFAKQEFAIRFSALISSYRLLMTCLISSCPPPRLPPPSPSWIWPRSAPALCLFPRLPVGLPLRLCGSSHAGKPSFAPSCASPPTSSKWTNWTLPFLMTCFAFGSSRTSLWNESVLS